MGIAQTSPMGDSQGRAAAFFVDSEHDTSGLFDDELVKRSMFSGLPKRWSPGIN